MAPAITTATAEPKKISDIKFLNPFKNKKTEFLVTVTVRKIDGSWWYNACKKCHKTAKPHGDSYKCSDPECAAIGEPTQRYKLCMIAGDKTCDVDFIVFGRWVQRLIKKTVDTLIAENPASFIPNEITRLLEKSFIWNVRFTQNTIDFGWICFQVNAIVKELNSSGALAIAPATAQSSSVMFSQDAGSSKQGAIQKSAILSSASLHSLTSSSTPPKAVLSISAPPSTPQSVIDKSKSEKETAAPYQPPEISPGPTSTPPILTQSPTVLQDSATSIMARAGVCDDALSMPGADAAKTQKSHTKKRSRPSPSRKISKKLQFTDENTGDEDQTTSTDATAGSSVDKDD